MTQQRPKLKPHTHQTIVSIFDHTEINNCTNISPLATEHVKLAKFINKTKTKQQTDQCIGYMSAAAL